MEKPYPPTRSRVKRALAEGDIPLSRAATRAAALLGVLVLVPALATSVAAVFRELLGRALTSPGASDAGMLPSTVLTLACPVLAVAGAAAALAGLAQTAGRLGRRRAGWPGAGSGAGAVPMARGAVVSASLAILLPAAALLSLATSGRELRDAALDPTTLVATTSSVLSRGALTLGLALLSAAALDLVVVRISWLRRLRMSRAELLEERRRTEGAREIRDARARARAEVLAGDHAARATTR